MNTKISKVYEVTIKERDVEWIIDENGRDKLIPIYDLNLLSITRVFSSLDTVNIYLKSVFKEELNKSYEDSDRFNWKVVDNTISINHINRIIDSITESDNSSNWMGIYSVSVKSIDVNIPVSKVKVWGGDDLDSIFEIFGANIGKLIMNKFKEYIYEMNLKETNVDSYRIGVVDSIDSMREYETYATCCGRDDTVVKIEGISYMFGCNYGH